MYERLGKAAERYVEILNSSEGWEELDDVMLGAGKQGNLICCRIALLALTGWSGGSPGGVE